MNLAPIALFVYARPDHARLTIEALQKNVLAAESDLFIFSDAARKPELAEAVESVRTYIKSVSGFKAITIVEREHNWGLANSIIDGVSRLCDEYGRVIVVEDDIVTTPNFLTFMNEALDLYVNDEKVMHISGYIFPIKPTKHIPETFFYRATSCWGWATWQRAWQQFRPDADQLLEAIETKNLCRQFDIDDTRPYTEMLRQQAAGKLDSWAVRWYASVFLANGMCLHPRNSLVENIGHDGSGSHCDISDTYSVSRQDAPVKISRISPAEENKDALQAIRKFNLSLMPSTSQRLRAGVTRRLRNLKALLGY